MKIKFPVDGGVCEVQANTLQARKCCVEAIKKGRKRGLDETLREEKHNKRGNDRVLGLEVKEDTLINVQLMNEFLTIELIPDDSEKVTKIGSKMKDDIREEVIKYLRKNKDIFAWSPQDLEGINPSVITHHLNLDPNVKLVK
ncbi:UNVERIFIED_CONTAM: hypothetical protein Sradi_3725800 [Sesamum radiatum]|uniref:Reverse transcriptase domain-containing protein n=1 Tax=Sesamum radiatum TaxID=300843 RepID=A0AAW2PYA3_SESRA